MDVVVAYCLNRGWGVGEGGARNFEGKVGWRTLKMAFPSGAGSSFSEKPLFNFGVGSGAASGIILGLLSGLICESSWCRFLSFWVSWGFLGGFFGVSLNAFGLAGAGVGCPGYA